MGNIQLLLLQTFYYAVLMVLTILIVAILLKGFFWKYVKVRLSFGKFVLVKIRTKIRDYFAVGWVEDDFLKFKIRKRVINLSLPDQACFYKSLSVTWIDINEKKGAISLTDYSAVSGFDAEKFSSLIERSLMKPSVRTSQEKILIALLVVVGIIGLATLGVCYMIYKNQPLLISLIQQAQESIRNSATIVGSKTI